MNGGAWLGNSVQKLFYLPEAHTDFVFSIWAEETGLAGALAVIALFALLVARILQTGWAAATQGYRFEAYVCFGVALMFSGQAFVNMGASSGLLPTKGLTLPFISYGGSSLIVSCVTGHRTSHCSAVCDGQAICAGKVSEGRGMIDLPTQAGRALIAAGGTGGHVYPALAVAGRLLDSGWSVDWVGTERGIEQRLVPAAGIPLHHLSVSGMRGKSLLAKGFGTLRLLWAVMESLAVIRRVKPDVVLGMGGYAAGPAGMAAWLTRRPS